jgi:hypothetical protein
MMNFDPLEGIILESDMTVFGLVMSGVDCARASPGHFGQD